MGIIEHTFNLKYLSNNNYISTISLTVTRAIIKIP